MKKGAIYGIIAAFIVIAMMIFLPVFVNKNAEPVITDEISDTARDTGTNAVTVNREIGTDEPETETEGDTTVFVTETKEPDATTEEETESATTDAETATAPDTTSAVTTKAPDTTEAPETTKAPVTTKIPETTAPETTAAVTTKPRDTTGPVETKLDPDKKYVAFTFDDGPDAKRSKLITDKMLEYNGKCTFFVIGENIYGDREKGMQYAYEHGMEIALHCMTHEHYYTKEPEYYNEEVYKGAEAIEKSIGVWPTLMRPPGGNITEEQYKKSEFPVILWSIDTNDWRYKRLKSDSDEDTQNKIKTIVNNALYDSEGKFNVKNGDIILMHEIYENSYDAFCIIIEELHKRGFEFVTVSELLQNPATGYKYYSATYKK